MDIPSVENLLAEISRKVEVGVDKPKRLELIIPNVLTLRGQLVPKDVAMAVLIDDLLKRGYWPDGLIDSTDGRVYKYVLSEDE